MSAPVSVVVATVADLKAKGWITDVIASLLIEASENDSAAVAELVAANKRQADAIEALVPLLGAISDELTCDAIAEADEASADGRAALARVGVRKHPQ